MHEWCDRITYQLTPTMLVLPIPEGLGEICVCCCEPAWTSPGGPRLPEQCCLAFANGQSQRSDGLDHASGSRPLDTRWALWVTLLLRFYERTNHAYTRLARCPGDQRGLVSLFISAVLSWHLAINCNPFSSLCQRSRSVIVVQESNGWSSIAGGLGRDHSISSTDKDSMIE
jgi:hypothetical protein